MQKAVRLATWVVVGLWSLLAWGSYAIIDGLGGFLTRHADTLVGGDPELTVALAWVIWFVEAFGLVAVVVIWGLVAAILLAIGYLVSAPLARAPAPTGIAHRQTYSDPAAPPRGPSDIGRIARDAMDRSNPPPPR